MRRSRERSITLGPDRVLGYHGCSRGTADAVLRGEPLIASGNPYDWLGRGIYFWEYAPYRALEWARTRFRDQAAVLRATIRLGECLNLLDREHFDGLARVYGRTVEANARDGIQIPMNSARGAHFLDRQVVDDYCEFVTEFAQPFQTVRGCFPEGEPIYVGSKILTRAHVQIAVRDPRCIRDLRLVTFD